MADNNVVDNAGNFVVDNFANFVVAPDVVILARANHSSDPAALFRSTGTDTARYAATFAETLRFTLATNVAPVRQIAAIETAKNAVLASEGARHRVAASELAVSAITTAEL